MSAITAHDFHLAPDEAIIADARKLLAQRDPSTLRPALRRLLRSRKPDVMVAGKFLWAHLTSSGGAA